jgi:hypothetical protein
MSLLRSALACGCAGLVTTACFGPGAPLIDFGRDCSDDAACADYVPLAPLFYSEECNEPFCDQGRCNTRRRDRKLADATRGDCRRPVCRDGSRTYVRDDGDTPSGDECQDGTCSDGWSSLTPKADGSPCSIGVCRLGVCRPAADAGADASDDDASADASDDG